MIINCWYARRHSQVQSSHMFLVDIFTIVLRFEHKSNLRGSLNNVQMLKILRLLRLARIAYKLELLTQYGAVALTVSVLIFGMMVRGWSSFQTLRSVSLVDWEIATLSLIKAHWLACFWYLIGISELNSKKGKETGVGWLYELARSLNTTYVDEKVDGEGIRGLAIIDFG